MNADCYVDKGFERLDENILNNKTMYAFIRHETSENVRLCNARGFCGPMTRYRSSHDAFLFRLLVPPPSQLLDSNDYRPNIVGIEQVLIFNFHSYAQFNTKNQSKILYIVHHHCSRIRNWKERSIQGKRIDHYLKGQSHELRMRDSLPLGALTQSSTSNFPPLRVWIYEAVFISKTLFPVFVIQ